LQAPATQKHQSTDLYDYSTIKKTGTHLDIEYTGNR